MKRFMMCVFALGLFVGSIYAADHCGDPACCADHNCNMPCCK